MVVDKILATGIDSKAMGIQIMDINKNDEGEATNESKFF